jgi:glutaminase
MPEISESFMKDLCEAKGILDKIVAASNSMRAYKNNHLAELAHAQDFGMNVANILKEYLGDEYEED